MIYRGDCEELYGREIPDPPEHDCLDHLTHEQADYVETHGFECGPYERWHEEWEECSVCGERFTDKEVARLYEQRENDGKAVE